MRVCTYGAILLELARLTHCHASLPWAVIRGMTSLVYKLLQDGCLFLREFWGSPDSKVKSTHHECRS